MTNHNKSPDRHPLLQWVRLRQRWFILPPAGIKMHSVNCIKPDCKYYSVFIAFTNIAHKISFQLVTYNSKHYFYNNLGQPCRCCTRHVRCHAGITTSLEAWPSPGWDTTRAALLQSRAASMSGTPWKTWRPHGQTHPLCSSTSQYRQTLLNQIIYVKTE